MVSGRYLELGNLVVILIINIEYESLVYVENSFNTFNCGYTTDRCRLLCLLWLDIGAIF